MLPRRLQHGENVRLLVGTQPLVLLRRMSGKPAVDGRRQLPESQSPEIGGADSAGGR